MQGFVASKLDEFEKGKISRRMLLESLTVAATTTYATGAIAAVAPDPALKVSIINHVSYVCPDFKRAADWYTRVLNLEQVGATNRDVGMPFGKQGEKPYGITANDIPLTFLLTRTRDPNAAPAPNAAPPRRPGTAVISSVAYTVADFDRERARADLRALGLTDIRNDGPNSLAVTDPYGIGVKVTGLSNTALTDV